MQDVFVLAITIELRPGVKADWLSKWGLLAQHVREHEPLTLAYETSEVEGAPNKLFVYERCALCARIFHLTASVRWLHPPLLPMGLR